MSYGFAEMIRQAREHNAGHWQLPFPQDVKLWLAKGRHLRVSFAWLHMTENGEPDFTKPPRFTTVQRHYVPPEEDPFQGIGGYVLCEGEFCAFCHHENDVVRKLRDCHGTVVVAWPTTEEGFIDREEWKTFPALVIPWVYSGGRHEAILKTHKEAPLQDHDILLSCEAQRYQRFLMTPCKNNLLAKIFATANNPQVFEERGRLDEVSRWQGWYSSIIHQANQIHPRLSYIMARPNLLDTPPVCSDPSPEAALDQLLALSV